MTAEAVTSWLMEHSSVPQTVLKPLATKLGVPTNYLGAALFAGQLIYENQDTIVTYASKGSVTVGEFLYERACQQYGEDHPLSQYLGENVDAITAAFEGTEAEAQTFAEFYRHYRAVDREHHLTSTFDLGVREMFPAALLGGDMIPNLGRNDPDAEDITEIPVTHSE